MPLLPILNRLPRRLLQTPAGPLVGAALVAGVCLAAAWPMWPTGAASPPAVRQPQATTAAAAMAQAAVADLPFEAVVWKWPEHLAGAAGMFQCWPAVAGRGMASVAVWTDSANNIVAFGAMREGDPWPAYADSLGLPGAAASHEPIQIAEQGHVVRVSAVGNVVQLPTLRLDCTRTWDD